LDGFGQNRSDNGFVRPIRRFVQTCPGGPLILLREFSQNSAFCPVNFEADNWTGVYIPRPVLVCPASVQAMKEGQDHALGWLMGDHLVARPFLQIVQY
jgi:hypothetical protein